MKNAICHKRFSVKLLAVRKANREIERSLLGDGFHSRTRIKKSKKVYSRKEKHRVICHTASTMV